SKLLGAKRRSLRCPDRYEGTRASHYVDPSAKISRDDRPGKHQGRKNRNRVPMSRVSTRGSQTLLRQITSCSSRSASLAGAAEEPSGQQPQQAFLVYDPNDPALGYDRKVPD